MQGLISADQSDACEAAFLLTTCAEALATAADPAARLARLGGLSVSIKDLLDVAVQPTRAASCILADAPPAVRDCAAVARLCGGRAAR